jgi:hypothetical protein
LGVALLGEIEEILVLADNDPILTFGVAAYVAVGSISQASFKDMLAIEAAVTQVFGERYR